ncbi:MAG TPA: hypothetical protein VM555_06490, partial [Tahibacter sp.]|nr:hypothetical protein [Tahibacter sp.]
MFCKFTDNINVSNGACSKRLRHATRIGARALLSIGVCFGLANEAFAQAMADLAVTIQGPTDAPAGQSVEYDVTIGNIGPAAADGAPFNIIFNPPLNVASATCNSPVGGAVCPPLNGAGPYAGAIPVLPSNSGMFIRIIGQAPGGT